MALILSIDTALEEASVCISEEHEVLAVKRNDRQSDHAAWIHVAIRQLFDETQREMSQLSAVAVAAGPGSYTGLRVGMATAKGICYALGLPLITESTLLLIAQRVKKEIALTSVYPYPVLICPMIDARRMEVFTTLYDLDLNEQMAPAAMVLDEASFAATLENHVIIFCGNGSKKWQYLCIHTHAVFVDVGQNVADLAEFAAQKFKLRTFSDLAYTEPAYLKNVYTGKNKP
jgi:tRNA threonylcarbamoyladenosine biosynthesis protein TsaB